MLSWFGIKSQDNQSLEGKQGTENETLSSPVKENQTGEEEAKAEDVKSTEDAGPKSSSSEAIGAAGALGFLRSMASVAHKFKESVDEKLDQTFIGDLERENEKFVKEKHSKRTEDPVPPWEGYNEEDEIKTQIMSLSSDERNFLRDPPSGIDFYFELDAVMPVALTILEEDKKLQDMRFKLVPKKVKEEKFWRNYFYRVSLIKQSSQLSTLAQTESKRGNLSKEGGRNSRSDLDNVNAESSKEDNAQTSGQNEPREDVVNASGSGLEAASSSKADGADWEKELQDELQEFEFVSEDQGEARESNPEWEKEIEDMLGLDEDDEAAIQ